VRSRLRSAAPPAALLTLGFGLIVVFQPLPFGVALRLWLVGLAALAAGSMVGAAIAPFGRTTVVPIRLGPGKPPAAARPAGLDEVERAVDFACWNGADLSRRLRPILREVAQHRLWMSRGIDLERRPELAERLLGAPAWALIDGSGDEPQTPTTEIEMAAAITRLEEI
jgi:hypothetical protein